MANPIAEALAPFVWGAGGSKKTPEEIARDKEIAADLLMRAGNTSPVGHWTQGAARMVDALGGVIKQRRADVAGVENDTYNQGIISGLLGGGTSPVSASAIPASGAGAELAATAPAPIDISGDRSTFVQSLLPAAIEESKRTGVDPRIIVAQAAQETGWGKSAPGNNFFGIKSHGQEGGQTLATNEVIDGKTVRINDSFRQFASPADSVRGYGDFLLANPRYQPMREAQGLDAQLEALGASGYATDPNYSRSVGAIARGIQLPQEVAAASPQAAIEAISPTGAALADPSQISTEDTQRLQALRGPIGGNTPYSGPGARIDTPMPVYDTSGLHMPQEYAGQAPAMEPPQEVGPAPVVSEQPMQAEPQAVAQAPIANEAIIRALTDPRATPQTRAIAQALMQQQQAQQAQQVEQQQWMERQRYEQQQREADPLRRQQLEMGQLELEQARQPKRQPLINAGNGNVYDPNTESWIQAPGGGNNGFRAASKDEANTFGAAAGQFGPDGRFYPLNPPQGTSLQVDPTTGAVTFNQGAGVKPLTEAQSKDTVFATRATNALPLVDKYEQSLLSLGENLAEGIPLNLGNYAQSEEYQVARDAGRDFLATLLRKDSGAAITPNEETIYGKMFLPQPGDKPAALQAKRQRRALAVEAIKAGMPPAAIENMAKALDTVPSSTDLEIQTDIPGVKIKRKAKP